MTVRIVQRVGGAFFQNVLLPAFGDDGATLGGRLLAQAPNRVVFRGATDPALSVEILGSGLGFAGGALTATAQVDRIRIFRSGVEIAVLDDVDASGAETTAAFASQQALFDLATGDGVIFNGAASAAGAVFRGGARDDRVFAGAAAEAYDGAAGFDTVSYAAAASAVGARLDGGRNTGAALGDVLRNFEAVEGSNFGDLIVGSAGANQLSGGRGADTLRGLGGDDTLVGGLAGDDLDGGDGFDTASYADATAAVGVRLDGGVNFGQAAGDVLRNVEALIGSDFADALVGSAGGDLLIGGGGGDRLYGAGGADTLSGGAGRDLIDGGDGFDTASYSTTAAAVGARLDGGVNFGAATGDVIRNVEAITGSAYNDALVGSNGGNVLRGLAGADRLFGLDGRDLLMPGGGARDLVDGGAGVDTVSYADVGAGVGARLDGGVNFGAATGDVIRNAENVVGTRFNDSLVGTAGANVLEGGAGADNLFGLAGADRFVFSGPGFGVDAVRDWQDGVDLLDFRGHSGVGAFSDLTITQSNAATRIDVGGDTVFLANTAQASVTAEDVLITPRRAPGALDGERKTELSVSFSGFDAKMGIDPPNLTGVAASSGDVGVQTVQSGDLIGLNQLRSDARFNRIDGRGYAVVVLDTGIDLDHRAFGPDANGDGVSDRIVYAQDFSNDGDNDPDDVQGHGTNVSSIVGSSDPNFLGVAPGVDIIHLQVLDNSGRGSSSNIEQGLQWVVRNAAAYNVVSVNLSLGPGNNINRAQASSGGYADEFAALHAQGVVTTVAAGNDYGRFRAPGMSSIAVDPNVIGVGAVWDAAIGTANSDGVTQETGPDRITFFSQRSADNGLDTLFAPGALITGAAPGGGSSAQGGTSQAAPHIAGLVALAQQIAERDLGRRLTPDEFEQVVRASADQINDGDDEADNLPNTGANFERIDAFAMAQAILNLAPNPNPNPNPNPTPGGDVPGGVNTNATFSGPPVNGVIDAPGDQDWYRVVLQEGVVYRFELLGQESGAGSLSDPLLVLRDANGRVVAQDDDSGLGLESRLELRIADTGTYYLSAQAYGENTGGFRLEGARLGAPATDLPETANTPSTLSPDAVTRSDIGFDGDRDWHRLEVAANTRYEITLDGAGPAERALYDPYLRVVDASGNLIAQDDDGGGGLNSALEIAAGAARTLFVSAGSFGDFGVGDYAISVTASQAAADLPSDRSTPATLTPGATAQSTLDFRGDTDWFSANLAPGRYRVDLEAVDANVDPLLRARNAAGDVVFVDDDGGDGLNSRLEFSTGGGRVFLEADSFASASLGDYRITLTSLGAGGGDAVPGDPSTTARLAVNDVVSSDIDAPGDRDWFVFDAPTFGFYSFALSGDFSNSAPLDDPYLRLRDAAGTLIAENDDANFGNLDSLLTVPLTPGRYFLEAGAFDDAGAGAYDLFSFA